jgi:hypothetical protein
MTAFDEWWNKVEKISREKSAFDFMGDKSCAGEAFVDGFTPEEYVDECICDACQDA